MTYYPLAALFLGLLGDWLFRATPWGLNLPLWVWLAAVAVALAPGRRDAAQRDAQALVGAAGIAAAAVAWRAAPVLTLGNLLATATLLVLALVRARGARLESLDLGRAAVAALTAAGNVAAGGVPLLAAWRPHPSPAAGRRLRAVTVGIVLALPVSAVFTALLAAADPVFERAVHLVFSWDPGWIVSHSFLTVVIGWLALGFLLGFRPRQPEGERQVPAGLPGRPALGLVELGIPLGALAALFAIFVGIQARYFFGGDAVVLSTAELGWGDYARRGFFELVAVTGLVVPLLLAAHGAVNRADPAAVGGVRSLSVVLLGLVALIAGSACYRLWLYYGVYGLTPTRVYAAALVTWICLVLAWLGATVLRDRGGAFPIGAVVSGLAVLACLNVLNPDALVARVNLARATAGAELDVELLASLSADAAPALARGVASLPPATRCTVARAVSARRPDGGAPDWRNWNAARVRAPSLIATVSGPCGFP
ncbi:MAG TPA: DUF4173 domain-containing protein [Gemmatimonadales bacterium]|nr:DUF4173 domain-containing protein [Gemmatimonadales bacterium]